MKIIFFGSSKHVIPVISTLKANFDLVLVVTTEKDNETVPSFCTRNKIPYKSVTTLSDPDLKSLIINLKSPIATLGYFRLIIPKYVLAAFPKGIINIHPSLLPKYRGPSPVQNAILNGDKITGVSIMKLDEEVDHGPILAQEKEEVLDTDTSETLYKKLFDKGASLLIKCLKDYIDGNLQPIAQNHKEATFTKPLTRQDGFLNLRQATSDKRKAKIARMVRAYSPWPGVWFKANLNGKEKTIKLLPGEKIQVEGKKPMSYKDFLNGYHEAIKILQQIR